MKDVFFKLTMVDANDGKDLTSELIKDSWKFDPENFEENKLAKEEICNILTDYIKLNVTPELVGKMIDNLQES